MPVPVSWDRSIPPEAGPASCYSCIVKTAISKTLRSFLAEHPELAVASVYLFGSHAAGRDHRESDVDLGFLLDWERQPTRRDRFEVELQLTGMLPGLLGVPRVDAVILNDAPPLFGRRIVREGERLVCNDEETDRAFLRDIQLKAADLQPFLEKMAWRKLEALAR